MACNTDNREYWKYKATARLCVLSAYPRVINSRCTAISTLMLYGYALTVYGRLCEGWRGFLEQQPKGWINTCTAQAAKGEEKINAHPTSGEKRHISIHFASLFYSAEDGSRQRLDRCASFYR